MDFFSGVQLHYAINQENLLSESPKAIDIAYFFKKFCITTRTKKSSVNTRFIGDFTFSITHIITHFKGGPQ